MTAPEPGRAVQEDFSMEDFEKRMEKLRIMRNKNIITQEEFESKKRQILDSI